MSNNDALPAGTGNPAGGRLPHARKPDMAYRLKDRGNVPGEIRRIVEEQIDRASADQQPIRGLLAGLARGVPVTATFARQTLRHST